MSRQAIVGLFTLVGLVGLFAVYFVLADLWTRASGYQVGIHFSSAAGLVPGSAVYESGIQIGTVAEIRLLDDFTVSVIVAVKNNVEIPRDSRFSIEAPLTGSSTLRIVPPKVSKDKVALLPHQVLPIEQQPTGRSPVALSDLLAAGQGQLGKLDAILTDLQKREPALLDSLQSALNNANALATTANSSIHELAVRTNAISSQLQSSLTIASANVIDLTKELDSTLRRNEGRVDSLLASLNKTADSFAVASDQLRALSTNPELRENLMGTVREIARTTKNMADLTADLRSVTGDPTTQAQLKNTIANVNAATQRANSLLGSFGGTSSVYGVDSQATPVPQNPRDRIVPVPPPPGVPLPAGQTAPASGAPSQSAPAGTKTTSSIRLPESIRQRIGQLSKDLVQVQIRIESLSAQAKGASNTALLNSQRGPQGDFNLVFAPRARTGLMAGVNDLSANQTFNFALMQKPSPNVTFGGGVLYSRLGALGSISNGIFGFEGRAYGIPGAYLDGYLHVRPMPKIDLFAGERDILHAERRTVYGLQFQF